MGLEVDPDVQLGLSDPPKIFSVPTAAQRLGISASHLYQMVQRGDGPERLPGFKNARFSAAALDAFAAARPAAAAPRAGRAGRAKPGRRGRGRPPLAALPGSPAMPPGAIDWAAYAAYAPRVVDSLEGADTWPAGVYLTPLGLLVRLCGPPGR